MPISGVTYKVARGESLKSIAAKYDVSEEEILAYNDIGSNGQLQIGQKLMIPGGKKDSYAENKPKTYSGLSLIKDLIKPSSNTPKPTDSAPRVGNKMNWPTVGYRITQYFSWRHFGIDVANKIGTPLYAADAGVVEVAGWGNGYGNQILINHGGGKKTRYAHLSKFSVKKGDHVNKGQVVGLMGSTGWSTGSHIHFEVIINGVKYNPLNYVK
ncbi:MAG: Peptidase M23 family protein [Parcubacteria group bacterium GW2011_GWE2_38_18]|nr:MAG: Peptidase M23 family protein [Parcubacteria group bacterium GW2011_GWE2_38_18]